MEKWTELDTSVLGPVGAKFFKFAVERIKGQDKAIWKLARALDRNSSAFKIGGRPIYVALLVGGAGSGKTLLARTLAEFWFGSPDAFTEIACSNFTETNLRQAAINQYDLNYFKAADPVFRKTLDRYNEACEVYIEAKGELEKADGLEFIKLKKLELETSEAKENYEESLEKISSAIQALRSVIVLDHIEDGPARLQDQLAMIFENGIHYDKDGNPVSLRNSVIFVTCNSYVALDEGIGKKVGFISGGASGLIKSAGAQRYLNNIEEIKGYLSSKFLSHLDRVEIFREYADEVRLSILEIFFKNFHTELAKNFPLEFIVSDEVKKYIVKEGRDHPEQGIRLLMRKFDKYIRDKIAILIAHKLISRTDEIRVEMKISEGKDTVVFSRNDKS